MKILEKHNYEFTAQFDETQKLHSLKCELLERDPDPFEPYLRIKTEHLQPLFEVQDNELMTAEYEEKEDSLYIQMTFKVDDLFFQSAYLIDLSTGAVRFAMDKPFIDLKEFVIPEEFEADLKERIMELKGLDKQYDSINDARLDRYFSDKYLNVFIDYAGYMEQLVKANRCNECKGRFKYNLSGFCKGFYKKNRFD